MYEKFKYGKSEISLSKTTPIDFKEQKKSYYAGVI